MDLNRIKSLIPDHARDLRLNISSVLSEEGAPGLSRTQILGTALASAIAARNPALLAEIETLVEPEIGEAQVTAARLGCQSVFMIAKFRELENGYAGIEGET